MLAVAALATAIVGNLPPCPEYGSEAAMITRNLDVGITADAMSGAA